MSLNNQNIIAISNKPETQSTWFCFPGFLSSVHSLLGTCSKAALPTFKLVPVAQFATRLRRDYWITNIPTCMHVFFFLDIKKTKLKSNPSLDSRVSVYMGTNGGGREDQHAITLTGMQF